MRGARSTDQSGDMDVHGLVVHFLSMPCRCSPLMFPRCVQVEGVASKSPKDLTAMFEEVSGSATHRAAYLAAREARDAADDAVVELHNKRKALAAERRQYKEQEREVARYEALRAQLAATQTEGALFRLYHLDAELRRLDATTADLTTRLATATAAADASGVAALRQAVEVARRERTAVARRTARTESELAAAAPRAAGSAVERRLLAGRLAGDQAALDKATAEAAAAAAELAALATTRSALAAERDGLDAALATAEADEASDATLAEYRRLKAEAAAHTSALQQQLSSAERAAEVATKQHEAATAAADRGAHRVRVATEERDGHAARLDRLAASVSRATATTNRARAERDQVRELSSRSEAERASLEAELRSVTDALGAARADAGESARESRLTAALASMRRLYPGVRGRLADLCTPAQPRYRTAVAVCLGRHMEAVVVDTSATAASCIGYLKEQRVGTATFLPLADLRPPPVDEALRQLGGSSKLVVDVIAREPDVAAAVRYAAADALVVDTLDEARALRYGGGGRRIKVCSLDGTLLAKSGFMTGGGTVGAGPDGRRADRWDRAATEALQARRAAALARLAVVGNAATDRARRAEADERLAAAKQAAALLQADVASATRARDEAAAAVTDAESKLPSLQPAVAAAATAVEAAQAAVAAVRTRLGAAESTTFGDFAARTGYPDVAAYEAAAVERSASIREKRLGVQKRLAQADARAQYVGASGVDAKVTKLTARVARQKAAVDRLDADAAAAARRRDELTARLAVAKDEAAAADAAVAKAEAAATAAATASRAAGEEAASLRAQLGAATSRAATLRSSRADLVAGCRVSAVSLPVVETGGAGASRKRVAGRSAPGKKKKKRKRKAKERPVTTTGTVRRSSRQRGAAAAGEDDEEEKGAGDDDSGGDSSSDSGSGSDGTDSDDSDGSGSGSDGDGAGKSPQRFRRASAAGGASASPDADTDEAAVAARDAATVFDYSALPRGLRSASLSEADRKAKEATYESSEKALAAKLETLAPNMRAGAHLAGLQARLETLDVEAAAAVTAARAATAAYEAVREARISAFRSCYDIVEAAIHPTYADLTRSPRFPSGGTAYLSLEAPDEPYAGGIVFNAQPPGKRVYDMGALSGGERSVAALALLFAVHAVKPCPFFVLDEVDAALDKLNVAKVAAYFARRAPAVQTIVISLKDAFYERADALVGIYRDRDVGSSRLATLDLTQFAETPGGMGGGST